MPKPHNPEPADHYKAKMKVVDACKSLGWDAAPEMILVDERTKLQGTLIVSSIKLYDPKTGVDKLNSYPKLRTKLNSNFAKRNDIVAIIPDSFDLICIEVEDIADSIHGKKHIQNRDAYAVQRIQMISPDIIQLAVSKSWINATPISDIAPRIEAAVYAEAYNADLAKKRRSVETA